MKWVIIDTMFLCYRALYAIENLSAKEVPTGVLFGFLEQLLSTCNDHNVQSNKVILCFDSKYSYRSKVFKDYKKKRRDDRTDAEKEKIRIMYEQVAILRKRLPEMGFICRGQKGLESDDVMAQIAKQLTKQKEKGIIITADNDLLQCVTPYISFYDSQRGTLYDEAGVIKKKGIEPSQWGMVKAIGGCTSDNVPGVTGVGEAGAVKWLTGEMPNHYKKAIMLSTPEAQQVIKEMGELTILPHTKTRKVEIEKPVYTPKGFVKFCKEYELATFLENPMKRMWIKLFKGDVQPQKAKRRNRR